MLLIMTEAPPFSLGRSIIVLVVFLMIVAFAVVIIDIEDQRFKKEVTRRRALEILRRKEEARLRNQQELRDYETLDRIERYRNDFDENSQAG